MKPISLYIHIPFCKSKCYYCDFPSFANKTEKISEYVDALINEIDKYKEVLKKYVVKTIFIGGGTPTLLQNIEICRIIDKVRNSFFVDEKVEFTIESNPGTLSNQLLKELKNEGINRLSIGLQATQNHLLEKIGRIHNFEQFSKNYELAREVGFENINVDLMFSLPEQSFSEWKETLEKVIILKPEHISCYSLILEENTKLNTMYEQGKIILPDEDTDRKMYYYACNYLENAGYKQYEISNFARNEKQCKHNIVYWKCEEYVGMGLGSHSYFDNTRYNNTYDLDKYIKSCGNIEYIREQFENIDLKKQYEEMMFLGLRMLQGIDKNTFRKKFNVSIEEIYGQQIKKMVKSALLEETESVIKLTKKGIDFSNIVFQEFLI